MDKLRMRAEDLRVDSFPTAGTEARRGTVRAYSDCTQGDSCYCRTAYAVCGTGPATIYSCDYTADVGCDYTADAGCDDTVAYPCERTAMDCPDTSYQVCGTPPITPVC